MGPFSNFGTVYLEPTPTILNSKQNNTKTKRKTDHLPHSLSKLLL
jgi:hypothetical protein